MNNTYLTVDLEEWYELDYLKNYNFENTTVEVVPRIYNFLDLLDKYNIKATFFVVADIAEKNADVLKEIARKGHCIACHGFDHKLLYDKSNDDFRIEVREAKKIIETIIEKKVEGYRASCFSLERDKLEILKEEGYTFDSSKIVFAQHPLYRNLDLSSFDKVDDLVYSKNGFYEYEIPTLDIWHYSVPISGGGYLRLFPYWFIRILIFLFEKKHKNFVIYLHPFELTDMRLPLPKELGILTKFRCLVGRRYNLKKIEKLIKMLINRNSEFKTMEEDRKIRMEQS